MEWFLPYNDPHADADVAVEFLFTDPKVTMSAIVYSAIALLAMLSIAVGRAWIPAIAILWK